MGANVLTTSADLDQVRKALDASLTVDDLPDTTIQLPLYLEVGEALVIQKVPGYAALGDVDKLFFRTAVVAQVAALLAPAMPGLLPKSEEGLTFKVTREAIDWERKAATLQAQVAANLGRLNTATSASFPTQMVLSGPTRKAASTS